MEPWVLCIGGLRSKGHLTSLKGGQKMPSDTGEIANSIPCILVLFTRLKDHDLPAFLNLPTFADHVAPTHFKHTHLALSSKPLL